MKRKYIHAMLSAFLLAPGIIPAQTICANDEVIQEEEWSGTNETAEYDLEAAGKTVMYRLYNPNSGEHFYTSSQEEKDHLVSVGWTYEGTGWVAPESSEQPVYRLYNPNAGDHHYTMNKEEKDHLVKVGWKYEGIGWYSSAKNTVPLYRQYNPNATAGSHNYTTSKNENDDLVKLGWKAEGIGWYALEQGQPVNYKDIYRPYVNRAKNILNSTGKYSGNLSGLLHLQSSGKTACYSLQDLNADGIPELSICDEDGRIYVLYTVVKGKVVIVESDGSAARFSLCYVGNGFRSDGSTGMMTHAYGLYTLNTDGTKNWSILYFTDFNGSGKDITAYRNTSGIYDPSKSIRISMEEYRAKTEEIKKMPSQLKFYKLSTY